MFVVFVFANCGDNSVPCQSDADCREGFRCDQRFYEGQCVQSVYVFRCGPELCLHGSEVCVDDQCQPMGSAPPPETGGMTGEGGQMGGAGGNPMPTGGTPTGVGGGGGDGGSTPPEDAGIEVDAPRVVITAPFDGTTLLTLDPLVTGQVFDLVPDNTVRIVVDGAEPGVEIETTRAGRFEHRLSLAPGRRTISVIAEQGGVRGEASVTIRVDTFVVTRNGRFILGENEFRFAALTMPGLLDLAVSDPEALDQVLAQAEALGARVIRTRAYDDRPNADSVIQTSPGNYADTGLAALDLVIERAGNYGLKLLLSLGDGGTRYGGPDQYLRWNGNRAPVPGDRGQFFIQGELRNQFKSYVRTMVTRVNGITDVAYRSDPTIMGWIVLDDPDLEGAFATGTGAELQNFMDDLSQLIALNAPDQLVATGDPGFDTNPDSYGMSAMTLASGGAAGLFDGRHQASWQNNMRLRRVHFALLTLAPSLLDLRGDANAVSNMGAAWIRGHATLAALEGKPLVVSAQLDTFLHTWALRQDILANWFDEVFSLDLAGFALGNFYANGQETEMDTAAWSWVPGSEVGEERNEYTATFRRLANDLAEASSD